MVITGINWHNTRLVWGWSINENLWISGKTEITPAAYTKTCVQHSRDDLWKCDIQDQKPFFKLSQSALQQWNFKLRLVSPPDTDIMIWLIGVREPGRSNFEQAWKTLQLTFLLVEVILIHTYPYLYRVISLCMLWSKTGNKCGRHLSYSYFSSDVIWPVTTHKSEKPLLQGVISPEVTWAV